MARIVRHEKNSPYEVAEGTELPIYICACGLSKNKPFCDGSHKKTRDENPSYVYLYDDARRIRPKTQDGTARPRARLSAPRRRRRYSAPGPSYIRRLPTRETQPRSRHL